MSTISLNSIKPGTKVYINGIVDYSRIASILEGAELVADDAKKVQRGMQAVGKPHTRLSLRNCTIDYEDPTNPSLAEKCIEERFYKSAAHPEHDNCYTAYNKTQFLPNIYCRENNISKQLEAVAAAGELRRGTPVTIMLRFFKAPQNNGVSLDTVIVNEKPIKWLLGNPSESMLAERGFEVVRTADGAPAVADVMDQLDANAQAAPVAPVQTAVPAAPAAPYVAAPVAPAVAPVAPAPVAAAPAPVENPAPSLPVPPNGYMYDNDGRIVPIPTQQPTGGIKL